MPKNNTTIHKTHSKKDLLNYIRIFSIPTGLSPKNNKFQVMKDPMKLKNVTIKVSPMVQKKLNDKQTMMNVSHYKCKIKKGSFWISFD